MVLKIESLRTDSCLYGFRCKVREIEGFAKKAFKFHNSKSPNVRVRCLYEEAGGVSTAIGFYSLSFKQPEGGELVISKSEVYSGDQAFLYIDHFAVNTSSQGKKHSNFLMVDLLENAYSVISNFGRVHHLTLNAADSDAVSFFKNKWGFAPITNTSFPFMVLDRSGIIETFERITSGG